MTLRGRVLISSAFLVLLPLAILAVLIRTQISGLVTKQFEQRLAALGTSTAEELAARDHFVHDRLGALRRTLADDNRFRQALQEGEGPARAYLLDYGERIMPVLGLAVLQIRDADGTILSSGHFRGEHGRSDPELYKLVRGASARGSVLGRVRSATSPFLALLAVDSLAIGGRRLCLVGGTRIDEPFLCALAGRGGGAVSLIAPGQGGADEPTSGEAQSSDQGLRQQLGSAAATAGGTAPAATAARGVGALPVPGHISRAWEMPFILAAGPRASREGDAGARTTTALWIVTQPRAPLVALQRSLDRWLLAVLLASAGGMLAVAAWLSARVSRPLEELARRTAAIDLDHLQIGFETRRGDEVGALARLLAAMIERLRGSAEKLREAERRATLGEMARQVNHDIRNGLAPIRNIMRHMAQIVAETPERAAAVFAERHAALESSVSYLESLADNYARISIRPPSEACDLGAVARDVARGMSGRAGVAVRAIVGPDLAVVEADPIGLRRIVENLVRNACESLAGRKDRPGEVRVLVDNAPDEDGQPGVRLVVNDNGPGIPREALGKIFQDFYTTKQRGAGLGLSIVRRLVTDFHGRVRADSVEGEGAAFTVWLPAAGGAARSAAPGRPATIGEDHGEWRKS
jgi:signal transduction histidine kinase